MKKLLLIAFFVIFSLGFAESNEVAFVDYGYVLDHYFKTIKYNEELKTFKIELEKKANEKVTKDITKEDMEKIQKKIDANFEELKTKYTKEIVTDIQLGTAFIMHKKNYEILLDKEECLYQGTEKDNLTGDILSFLNYLYEKSLNIKNQKQIDMNSLT